ncbi:MAG: hypothetical protein CXT73_06300 [Methanobacteriota archaeon]|nr:MAG: hypothetical protein CXT73_06300 [Euryarchaeota archaeon]
MNLHHIQREDSNANINDAKHPKVLLRNWCQEHMFDHHQLVLLDNSNKCYYIYEKQFHEFKPHHFNGCNYFKYNKFIENNENDIIFQNDVFKIILISENLKKKQRDKIHKNINYTLKKKKVIYIEF